MTRLPLDVAARDFGLDQIECGFLSSRFNDRIDGGAHAVAIFFRAHFAFLAHADEEHALGGDAGQAVEHPRCAAFAVHIAR